MRRLLAIILAATMLFILCSCKTQPTTQPPETTQATQTTSPTVSNDSIEYKQQPMYAVSLAPVTEETADDGGKVRFVYSYQNLSLFLPEAEVAEKILIDYLSRIDKAEQYADMVRTESLLDEYDSMGSPFMYNIAFTPMRLDTAVLSLLIDEIEYMGWLHPNNYGTAVTYNLLSGNVLTLTEMLNENITAENIADAVVAKLSDKDESLWTNYKEIVNEMFDSGLEQCENWYFSENGLCFHFDPYVLAPYAAGPITAVIPYSELTGILRDEYFPAEQDIYTGTLDAETFTLEAQAEFTQFAEVVLVEGGTKILLSAEGAITDIRIQAITNMYGGSNIDGCTIMSVQSLTPGDAIMVEFDPATTILLIEYRNGDQYETKTITCNQDNITIS